MTANRPRSPSIVISASGMPTGGRVLHHLEHLLPDRRNTVVIVGFAAAGTRVRQLATGARELKIHGRYVPARAEIVVLDAFSAHADADELIVWAAAAPTGHLPRAREPEVRPRWPRGCATSTTGTRWCRGTASGYWYDPVVWAEGPCVFGSRDSAGTASGPATVGL